MTPDPTAAELYEWESPNYIPPGGIWYEVSRRLIKALRACRQRAKAKDAVIEAARDLDEPGSILQGALDTLAALDNLPSVAKQGETDDAE